MKVCLYIFILILSFLLIGCPGTLIESFEKEKEYKKNYKPNYNRNPKTKNYQTVEEKLKSNSDVSSKGNKSEKDSNFLSDFKLDILKIDSRNFPEEVELKVTLKDVDGKYISGLAPPYIAEDIDFKKYWVRLRDSSYGVSEISDFSVREIREKNSPPFSIVYLVDYSGSMSSEAKIAVNKSVNPLLRSSKKDDYISFIKFQSNAFVEVHLQKRKDFLEQKTKINVSDDSLSGGTNIKVAMRNAFVEINKSPESHQKLIVLISDGEDSFTKNELDSIKKQLIENNIEMYCISIGYIRPMQNFTVGTNGVNVEEVKNPLYFPKNSFLDWVTYISGGKHYNIIHEYEFPFVFADIYLKLKNYYSIRYEAPSYKSRHKVELSVQIPELEYEVIENGYYDKSIFREYDGIGEVKLLNLEFKSGAATINENSYELLENIVEYMKKAENIELEISGHTDNVGEEEINKSLSLQRAKAVKNYMVENGISKSRIEVNGYGEKSPIATNDTEEGRRKNRRTEFKIVKK